MGFRLRHSDGPGGDDPAGAAGPLQCSLRNLPATSNLLGKLPLAVRHADGWIFPREVLEALEADEDVILPARYSVSAAPGGVAVAAVTRRDTAEVRRRLGDRLEEQGVPLAGLTLHDDPRRLRHAIPLRGDLREAMFGDTPSGVSASGWGSRRDGAVTATA